MVTALIWVIRLGHHIPATQGRLVLIRILLMLAAMVAVSSELAGYRNLANFILGSLLATLAGSIALWTALWGIQQSMDSIVQGSSAASYKIRAWMGIRHDSTSIELGWIRLIMSLLLWVGFGIFLIFVWDTTGNAINTVSLKAVEGISIGEYTLKPASILTGLLVFAIIVGVTVWIKARLSQSWLRNTIADRGARDAMVTLSGYVGFIIAAIIGLNMAGVSFQGLAWIGAALSVGIGFGLQAVVSNFVSGLILLFERPIKSGDFISVGDIEGFVRQIRIRSTEIETLERQNVIVPNSELISTQVTNWVLRDPHGRLSIEVGVAYGTDIKKVKEILEDIATEHPEVITKGRTPPPRALFMEFGDSSLNFELRVWIRQITKRFAVTSEVNFAIDAAFKEHGIEIPFPQRDLNVRSWSEGAVPKGGDGES
ncbi:MAG: mechanosensitive ion channel domain-containing protein [Pseudomonadota bacterium]